MITHTPLVASNYNLPIKILVARCWPVINKTINSRYMTLLIGVHVMHSTMHLMCPIRSYNCNLLSLYSVTYRLWECVYQLATVHILHNFLAKQYSPWIIGLIKTRWINGGLDIERMSASPARLFLLWQDLHFWQSTPYMQAFVTLLALTVCYSCKSAHSTPSFAHVQGVKWLVCKSIVW